VLGAEATIGTGEATVAFAPGEAIVIGTGTTFTVTAFLYVAPDWFHA
jgi:hypothetical protein